MIVRYYNADGRGHPSLLVSAWGISWVRTCRADHPIVFCEVFDVLYFNIRTTRAPAKVTISSRVRHNTLVLVMCPVRGSNLNASSRLTFRFRGDEVRSRGQRLSPWSGILVPASSCPHLHSRSCKFCWMWTLLVVILAPDFDLATRIAQSVEPVRVQTLIAQSSVEALGVRPLRRLAGLNELKPLPAFDAPRRQCSPA
jgi:hypothetical protein